jgi:23S rRNA (guanosine2251-2'-O)-methyltransferase
MDKKADIIAGRNPVMEALKSGIEVNKILIVENKGHIIKQITGSAKEKGIPVEFTDKKKLDSLTDVNPQGVAALVSPVKYVGVDSILNYARQKKEDPLIMILDGIQDPANLGSIIRTSEVMGVHGIVIPKRRSVGITTAVTKISAGAVYHQRIARVSNISQIIKELKDKGLWIAACDMGGETYYAKDLTGPLAVVIGGEGKGVSKLVLDNCDFTLSIPVHGKVNSLNAGIAAAITVSEVMRQRRMENGGIPDS